MNWDAVGAIAEIVGAIAVILTLAYLAVQIRQNTKAVRASALDACVTSVSVIREKLIESSEVTELYVSGSANPESLNDVDSLRFEVLLQNILWSAWNMYSQSNFADLTSIVWKSQEPVIKRVLTSPGGKSFWEARRLDFEEAFRIEFDSIINAGDKAPLS